ncbi:MAG TPA: hypothetical protein VHU41_00095 [Thermoanaerobaculia bacterium]|nr:hypothetical protein [Thermoanaerobaculia bacterium]
MRATERAAMCGVVLIYIALRAPLLAPDTLPLGWNSDAAIFGLMAKSIFAGRGFPIFFWGQSYMGPLTSWVTVLVALFTRAVNPFALRIAAMLEGIGAIVFFWLGLRRTFDARSVAVAMLWVAIGPAFLLSFVVAPIGAEQMFFLSALLFWFGSRNWFWFGVLSGFGWWINQGVAFVIVAVILVEVWRSEWWAKCRAGFSPPGRAKARPTSDYLVYLLLFDALLGAVYELGLRVPSLFLYHPVLDPFALAVVIYVLGKLPLPIPPLRTAVLFAGGFFVGYAPVIIGGFLHAYPSTYSSGITAISFGDLPGHIRAVAPDLLPFAIGLIGIRKFRSRPVELMVVALALIFYLGSARVHPGQARYIVAALPIVYAFAAEELMRWRGVGWVAAAVVAVLLAVPRMREIRDVRQARMEWYGDFLPSRDPRPILANIEHAGYRTCYADYWLAYKLEWISDGKVRFIPFHSYDRTPAESRRRIAVPEPKCFVAKDGSVTLASVPPPL